MTVSVIIPTYNGALRISQLMQALQKQSYRPDEVIVVIDGSTDSTDLVLQGMVEKLPLSIIKIKNSGRAIARNTGAKAAHGDLLVFYDDDMEPNFNSIAAHVKFHQTSIGLLTGNPVETQSPRNPDIQHYKAWLTQQWTTQYADGLNELSQNNLFFTTANCSIKAADFKKLGGFNETLTDAEDYELALRALKSGRTIYFDKTNFAIHHDVISCQRYIKRQQEYKRGRVQVQQVHSDTPLVTEIRKSWLKWFLYTVLSSPLFPKLIDSFNVFLILPKSLRYRLYSAVIHAHAN